MNHIPVSAAQPLSNQAALHAIATGVLQQMTQKDSAVQEASFISDKSPNNPSHQQAVAAAMTPQEFQRLSEKRGFLSSAAKSRAVSGISKML